MYEIKFVLSGGFRSFVISPINFYLVGILKTEAIIAGESCLKEAGL